MKRTSLIFLVFVVGFIQGDDLTGFRVKHAWSGALANVESYFQMPRNKQEADTLGFNDVPYQSEHGYDITMKCHNNDVRVCALFDRAGYAAGLQIAIPRNDVENTAYDIASHMKLKSLMGQDYWTTTHYIESPETMRSGGRKGLVKETIEGIWIENGNEIMNIPISEKELSEKTLFKKQNCIPGMGTHYYYNVNPDLDCQKWLTYFVLVKNGKVIGIGFQIFGKTEETGRKWFESPPSRAVEMIIPSAPPCLGDWAKIYSVISLHMYYIEEPWKITCEDGDSFQPMSVVNKLLLNTSRYFGKVADGIKSLGHH